MVSLLPAGQSIEKLTLSGSVVSGGGNELANSLTGNAADNSLNGMVGADTMAGLGGNDFYYVDNSDDVTNDSVGAGTDQISTSVSYALATGQSIEILSTTSNFGTATLNLTGNELANAIYGNDGANYLDGQGGIDSLNGLRGNDVYLVDNAADIVNEVADGGYDRLVASVTYTLKTYSEIEALTVNPAAGISPINLTGNEIGNILIGNAGPNLLVGSPATLP